LKSLDLTSNGDPYNFQGTSLQQSLRECSFFDLGYVEDYVKVWELQKKLVESKLSGKIQDALIVVEHGHVITLGRSSHKENVLLKELPIVEVERGGDATYHGPGQLVAYPIISLHERSLGVRQYVELLEDAISETLKVFGIRDVELKTGKETGVWIAGKRKKIASIGIAISHWVTYHGLALNVNTDLSYFSHINPCGLESSIMTSMAKELGTTKVDLLEVKRNLVSSLSRRFRWVLVQADQSQFQFQVATQGV
jgi:lipoate-protein ligase B